MKKLLLTLLGLGVLGTCQAQIAVYKMNLTDTTTGNGQTLKQPTTGYFIVDFSNNVVAFVQVFPSKHFSSFEPASTDFDYGPLVGAKAAQGWAFSLNKTFGSLTASGKAAPLNLGVPGVTVALPKTMTISGAVLSGSDSTSGIRTLDQFKGALAFDLPDTTTANQLGDALSDTENRLIAFLQSKGDIYDGTQ
jgi:hypothetical protein